MASQYVITISGYDRCGKDTLAEMINSILIKHKIKNSIIAFADPIKEMVKSVLKIDNFEFNILLRNKDVNELSVTTKQHENNFFSQKFKKFTLRDVLINTGKKMKQKYGNDFFAKLIVEEIKRETKTQVFIIPDLRFKVEDKVLMSYTDYRSRVLKRPSVVLPSFKYVKIFVDSEIDSCGKNGERYDVDKLTFDYKIVNRKDKGFKYSDVEKLLKTIGILDKE